MPTKTSALVLTAAILLFGGSSASASTCRSDIDGDHVTAANDFQAQGITCENALRSAAGYTDSAAALEQKGRFTAQFYEWRYQWTCKITELPPREQRSAEGATYGSYYRCHATEELGGRRRGTVSMSFKWFLPSSKSCPDFALEEAGQEATEVSATRNVSCAQADHWLQTAVNAIQFPSGAFGAEAPEPYRVVHEEHGVPGTSYYYHYFDSGLYECVVSPVMLSASEPAALDCLPVKRTWESGEYRLVEKKRQL